MTDSTIAATRLRLTVPCPQCHAKASERCTNYKGQYCHPHGVRKMPKTVQVVRSNSGEVLSFQQNDTKKLLNREQFGEGMETKKNALQVAGEQLDGQIKAGMDLGLWAGQQRAFGLMAAKASTAQAQCLKRLKDGGEYKATGLTWEQFCVQYLGISRPTADRVIANLEEFGAAYFALSEVTRISANTYRMIAGAVKGDSIELDGESIPITKANAQKIAEAVAELGKEIATRDEKLAEQKREAEKLKGERSAASKAAEKARQDFAEYKRKVQDLYRNASPLRKRMLLAQGNLCLAVDQVRSVRDDPTVTESDLADLKGLSYLGVKIWIEATSEDPAELYYASQIEGARDLVTEYAEQNKGANAEIGVPVAPRK
jgi:hypothetical protein